MTVPIHVETANDIANECVAADVYFGDDKLAGAEVTAVLLPGSGSERVIKVTTRKFVNEPVVTVYLAAGCSAKVSRKFVAFADPPSAALPSASLSETEAPPVAYAAKAGKVTVGGLTVETGGSTIAAAPSDDGETAPKAARRDKNSNASSAKKSTAVATKAGSTGADALQGAPSMALSPRAQAQEARVLDEATLSRLQAGGAGKSAATSAQRSSGERLMLDPVDADALIQPNLTMTATPQGKFEGDEPSPEVRERRAAAAALWLALNSTPEQLARDQQRVQELEKRLASLKQESAQSQQQLVQLKARVQEAESARNNSTLVYALGGLAALLAAVVAVLFLKDRRQGAGSDWWKSDAGPSSEPTGDDGTNASPLERTLAQFKPGHAGLDDGSRDTTPAAGPPVVAVPTPGAPALVKETAPTFNIPPAGNASASPVTAAARAPRPLQNEAPREVSVEELIDLEQQAEFFIVLGQDDAALDLLESHVQSTTGASPLPFLKLLEIYQRLGKRQDYERVQAEFNQRFNGYAPAWESDLLQGHSLSEYPGIVERLQALWAVPAKAMDVLERSLTRPDAEVETFDLPAYRELLFLYAVARDLSEREPETRDAVDLSLPFVDPIMVTVSTEPETIEPLMATRPVKAQPQAQPMISLDLSLDDLEPPDAPVAAPPANNQIEFEHVDLNHNAPDKT
ncbi:hypothetical protein [Aquabacterium sp.]|uniref:type IV pilus assembly protein FimV n=1 Tax=Aquabacterium sp. TaxID=1872578 RepID=UPI0019899CC1|nr:hypothetical protein [Aquabacterium sp.]MBC7699338.1 hypothetical protein [Aquabacterium sp.]